MRVEFQYIYDDLREALIPKSYKGDVRKYASEKWRGLVMWPLIFIVVTVSLLFQQMLATFHPARNDSEVQDLGFLLAIAVLPAAWIFVVLIHTLWNALFPSYRKPGPRNSLKYANRRTFLTGSLTLIQITAMLLVFQRPMTLTWRPSRLEMVALGAGPWLVDLFLLTTLNVANRFGVARRQWNTQPTWQRPKVIELDELGLHILSTLEQAHFNWGRIPAARETANLLLLVTEEGNAHIIPKRAFPDVPSIDRAKALIQSKVPSTEFLTGTAGFEVVPLPVLPVGEPTPGPPA